MATRKTNYERYADWMLNRPVAERDLQATALDFEEKYFADVRLLDARIRKRLLKCEIQGDDGQWFETEDDFESGIDGWIIRYRRTLKPMGQCDSNRQEILMQPDLGAVEEPATLLHEMLHAYEGQLSNPLREWLTLELYRRMQKKLPLARLNRYIDTSTHSIVHNASHGVMFLLKSLELDLRFGWKPGTVFGYGRTDYLR